MSAIDTPQKGILKDVKVADIMRKAKEEKRKRVRFSVEGKSLAGEGDTVDHSDLGSTEDGDEVDMEAGDSDQDEIVDSLDPGKL